MTSAIYKCLRGKRVVVTGGGSGIGAALVEAFAGQGAEVHFLDIAEDESRALVSRLAGAAVPPAFHTCDLTDIHRIEACFAEIGAVDVLINNAGNDDRHALGDVTPAYFDQRIAVNLRHMLFCAQAVSPDMVRRGGGVIINLGSIAWRLGLPELAVYQMAKAGVEGMTRGLARDLGGGGVRVTCIAPGNVKTPRQELWYSPEAEAEILALQCIKGRIEPSDVAAMAMFLASDGARFCTGHTYLVDAGWS